MLTRRSGVRSLTQLKLKQLLLLGEFDDRVALDIDFGRYLVFENGSDVLAIYAGHDLFQNGDDLPAIHILDLIVHDEIEVWDI